MTDYFPNQDVYLLSDGIAVVTNKLEDYIKHFFKEYVRHSNAEFYSLDVDSYGTITINYTVPNEDCGSCEEAGLTGETCVHDWSESIDYKLVEVYGLAS